MNNTLKTLGVVLGAVVLLAAGMAGGLVLAQNQPAAVLPTQTARLDEPAATQESEGVGSAPASTAGAEATALPTNPTPAASGGWQGSGMMGMMYRWDRSLPAAYASLINPLYGDAQAVSAGQTLYDANCAACHGATGLGDGPAAAGLSPAPAPLAFTVPMSPDNYLFYRLSEGGSMAPFNSAMPAWKDSLTEAERWQIITYLRSLSGPGMMGWDMMGSGMMGYGGWTSVTPQPGQTLTLEQARLVAADFIASYHLDTLELGDIVEGSGYFYAQARRTDTGAAAFSFYIDATTSVVFPEMGPGMMWWHQGSWYNGQPYPGCYGPWGAGGWASNHWGSDTWESGGGTPSWNDPWCGGGGMGGWGNSGGGGPSWQGTPRP